MVEAVLGLALYLWIFGKWGKALKAKNTRKGLRHFYGIAAGAVMWIAPLLFGTAGLPSWGVIAIYAWCGACGILGYVTVAFAPSWIVGKPKTPTGAVQPNPTQTCLICGRDNNAPAKFCQTCGKALS
jgi:hypothetical protein